MSSNPEKNLSNQEINRRRALRTLGIGGLAALAVKPQDGLAQPVESAFRFFNSVNEMRADRSLRPGTFIRTSGYYGTGDGGQAEYLIKESSVSQSGWVRLANGLVAELINVSAINYRMFGALSDGKNDDGVQIIQAHRYANETGLPVVNASGQFWIRETNNIPIQTDVHWGHTAFHIDEKFNRSGSANLFIVSSKKEAVKLDFDSGAKARLLSQIKPGVTIIPELAPYKNSFVIITDDKDRIGYRSGASYGGKVSKPKEEFFFVEEHGRILGDIAWEFSDYSSLVAYPGNDSYLVIDGGTFYLSGETPLNNARNYVSIGFSVRRCRTVIRNQWVGLEPGNEDLSMAPKNGFYSFSSVYDVLLENVRLIPWEKDRPGTDRDVKDGTYGIGGNRVMNATFRNVTAEGSPIHWGVFGTNLFKNFRVEQCVLNRIDVHFHCWNLYIKDSKIGSNGITITGGGDLFVENTACIASSFIAFRTDYGAKWDGNIRIRNCRHVPVTNGETSFLRYLAEDFDYKYPIGYGRSIKVEDIVVDFRSAPSNANDSWLMRISSFAQRRDGGRVFFPTHLEFKNVTVQGRETGMRLISITDPQRNHVETGGSYDGVRLKTNCRMIFEDIQLAAAPGEKSHFVLGGDPAVPYADGLSLYPDIRFIRCNGINADFGGLIADVTFDQCGVNTIRSGNTSPLRGNLLLMNCSIGPEAGDQLPEFKLASTLGTSLVNCVVYAPRLNGQPKPELVDLLGFITLNKDLEFNHINTRLGKDILAYLAANNIKLNAKFVAMLKSRHELE